jgi:LacI family transcriptional regulator
VQGYFTYQSGLIAAERLLGGAERPSAIFASNDDMAAAVVSVAHRSGLDVPRDLTVVGFDDTAIARTLWPELTTVRQPIGEMAVAAVGLLLKEIRARKDHARPAPTDIVMAHTLIERQSSAACREGARTRES